MALKIFISYRRADSAGHAGRFHDRLVSEFGRDFLFMDVDALQPGVKFAKVLGDEVGKCDVLLAIIGPGWLEAQDAYGNRRLNDPNDIVRIEIGTALRRDIRVIPVLLDGTPVPRPEQLPKDLKELVARNALSVRHESFQSDTEKLIRALRPEAHQSTPLLKKESVKSIKIQIGRPPKPRLIRPGGGAQAVDQFRDMADAPEMVVIPAGEFMMGRPGKCQRIFFERPYAIGRFTVTNQEWLTAYKAGGVDRKLLELRDNELLHPVTRVSWHDANQYVAWLAEATGYEYRLPSEAEWEYAARADSTTHFWWGDTITAEQANYDGSEYREAIGQGLAKDSNEAVNDFTKDDEGNAPVDYTDITTVEVESYTPNPWGLYQVHGNVWEWCEDVWHENISGAPSNGIAWALREHRKGKKVVRGGSWSCSASSICAAARWRFKATYLGNRDIGIRIARSL